MAQVVIDASAMIEVLTGSQPSRTLRRRVRTSRLHAPELFIIEVLNVLRRQVRAGEISDAQGEQAITWLTQAPVALSQHRPLLPRVWELRNAVRAYDASYIALAERLKIPLMTTDGKLEGSNRHSAEIDVYPAS